MGHTGPGEKSMLGYIYLTVGLLAIDAAIEMGFVSGTVAFLHFSGGGPFQIDGDGQNFELAGAPSNLMVNQGHTSNGAAGTALVLVGFGGVLALCLERYSRKKVGDRYDARRCEARPLGNKKRRKKKRRLGS